MRIFATLFVLLWTLAAFAQQRSVTYSNLNFSITPSNLLNSNILAGINTQKTIDEKGRITLTGLFTIWSNGVAVATVTNLNFLQGANATLKATNTLGRVDLEISSAAGSGNGQFYDFDADKFNTNTATPVFVTLDTGAVVTTNLADNAVTDAKLRDSAAVSVIGRTANSTGDPTDIAAGANGRFLQRTNDTLAFGDIAIAHLDSIDASSELIALMDDETGSGLLVFGTSPTITTPTISGAISFPDNTRQTFNPGADAAGLNVGSHAGDPGTPSNGDLWYDSTANELTARVNGANVALGAGGSGLGYTIFLGTAGNVNPPDATTLNRGGDLNAASTETYDQVKVEVPKAGTIKRVFLKVRVTGTLGSGETVSHYIRLNDTTDVGQIDTTYDAATRNVNNTSVSQAVAAGDYIALKIVGPTWATNPLNVRWYCLVYIE